MIGVLIICFWVVVAGALPWWPYSAAGRLRHHRPWDWLMDSGDVPGEVTGPNDPRRGEPREACETRHPAPARVPTRHPAPAQVPDRHIVAAGTGRDLLVA